MGRVIPLVPRARGARPPRALGVEAPVGWASSSLADLHAVAIVLEIAVFALADVVEFAVIALTKADADAGASAMAAADAKGLCWRLRLRLAVAGVADG